MPREQTATDRSHAGNPLFTRPPYDAGMQPTQGGSAPPAGWRLAAAAGNVPWGYFDQGLAPALTVPSGAVVSVEAVTHHAGDAPDLLMDEGIAALFAQVTDRGPGPHILTGPIAIEGAAPGDVLEVRILSLDPRLDHGSNLAAHWGHLYGDFAKERV